MKGFACSLACGFHGFMALWFRLVLPIVPILPKTSTNSNDSPPLLKLSWVSKWKLYAWEFDYSEILSWKLFNLNLLEVFVIAWKQWIDSICKKTWGIGKILFLIKSDTFGFASRHRLIGARKCAFQMFLFWLSLKFKETMKFRRKFFETPQTPAKAIKNSFSIDI